MKNKKKISLIPLLMLAAIMLLASCSSPAKPADSKEDGGILNYRIADKEEGIQLMMSNESIFNGLTQNDLDFRMQETGASLERYKEFAKEQVRDFTDEQKAVINKHMERIINTIKDRGYQLPELEQIVFINTTMKEECGATAYTHGTQIYFNGDVLAEKSRDDQNPELIDHLISHELFHCMTRCSSEFRSKMYEVIHFTTQDKDYELPPSVKEYFITNPDVERHNSHASFIINGESVDCFMAFVTTRHFEKAGDSFFDCSTPALVPVDGTDTYYIPEEAVNFDEVFGTNTDYVIDPEECMANNFSYLIGYGMKGPEGKGYPNPEIISAIDEILKNTAWK